MSIAIIDYGSGNLRSAAKAFERAVLEVGLKDDVIVTADPDRVRSANRVVLPGVGAFGDCKAGLVALDGMVAALNEAVIEKARPFLGICVGMQLMADIGHEHGDHQGLGWIKGATNRITPTDPALKIPHMGWNELKVLNRKHPFFDDLPADGHAYFVHSNHMSCENPDNILAEADYGGPVTAVVGRDNLLGTQFHPEKSQAVGLHLIGNFLKWSP